MVFLVSDNMGWGNMALRLCDSVYNNFNKVNRKIIDYTVGVIEFTPDKIELTDDTEHDYEPKIFINLWYSQKVHSAMNTLFRPTATFQKFIDVHWSSTLADCVNGMHIRRGAYEEDSRLLGCHGPDKPAFFANDGALLQFCKIIEESKSPIFLTSDSFNLKLRLAQKYPDKIRIIPQRPVLSYNCTTTGIVTSSDEKKVSYLEWFLLSMCKHVSITAGDRNLQDFSTYGYSAACYGLCSLELVFNT
jgi:hypothetical protein